MAGSIIGGLLGAAFGGTLEAWGLVASEGLGWLFGASIGSLFDQPSMDFGSSSPNYSFSEIYNTKSQMLPIPICYGRVRVAGNMFMQQFYDDKKQKMDMFVGLSQGPIHRVINVYANDHLLFGEDADAQAQEIKYWILKEETHLVPGEENEEITEYSWVEVTKEEYDVWEGRKERRDPNGNVITVDLKECSCDVHLGTLDQLKDDRESGEYSYGRVAYLGITLKIQEGLTSNPTITTELEGREVWTPSGTRYTANPVWCIIDLLTNTDYGAGVPLGAIDIPAASDAAAYCDELVDGRPRYSLNYIIDQQRPAPDILRDMLMCCDGYIREREQITICVNRPVSTPDAYLVVNDVAKQGTFKWWQKGREETYNRVILEWVDPENHYERTSTPFEDQEDVEARGLYERNISLLGVTDPYQAARLGEQALHVAQTINNFCSFTVSVCDWDFEIGDVIGITESAVTGWDRKWFHVLHMQDDPQSEECTVTLVEYDGSTYVDTPSQVPASTDNPDPPVDLDDYTNLLLTDEGSQQVDGTYVPKIRVRYTPPSAEMKEHVVSWWHNDEEISEKKVSPQVRDVLISEGISTGKALTVRVWGTDINGKPRTGVIGQIVPGHDDIAPSPPTSLTTNGWFGEIILNWVNPTTNEDGSPCKDLAYIEIWASSTDDRETAVKIGEVNGTNFRHHLGSFAGRYYWIRAVDTSGNISQWNAEAGVYGNSDQETHQDFVDVLLEQNPYLQEAIDDLNTPIEQLEIDVGNIKDISIPAIEADITGIDEVAIPAINTRIDEVEMDLPKAIQKLSERVRDIDESVMAELNAVSESAVEALLNISEANGRITDAGIITDPDTGEVRIWAVDQLKQETELRLVNAEMLISAQDAKIAQKVTLAEVDNRIAQAVFGDVGELLVSGLNARIDSVQQTLDATNAELLQKATQVEVDALGGRVGDAEVRISGAEAAIDLKATKIEVGEIGTRVTNAENEIDALNGQITQTVTAIGQDGKDLANLTAEGLVEAILNDADNHDRSKVSLAMAKEELYANIEEGLEAEAGQRTELAAVVDDNKALILEEKAVRATQDEAIASSVELLTARVGDAETSVQTEAEARSTETASQGAYTFNMISKLTGETAEAVVEDILNQAEAREVAKKQYAIIRQEYNTKIEEGLLSEATKRETLATKLDQAEAVIQEDLRVLTSNDEALAESMQTMGVKFGEDLDVTIQTERIARADADKALGHQITTLQSRVSGNEAAIQDEATTRTTADEALAEEIHTVRSKTEDNEAAIQTVSKTFADESSATGSHVFTMVSRLTDQTAEGLVEDVLNQAEGREKAKEQYAIIREEYDTKIEEGILSEATKRELLAVKLDETEAAIQKEAYTCATQDEATSARITTVTATVVGNTSAIQTEATTRASADSALGEQIATLQSSVENNLAAIQSEATTRVNADSALSNTLSTVSAVANAKNKTFRQATAPTEGMMTGDLWFDSDDSNKPYRYSGSTWVATNDTRIAANTAAIQNEVTARADADGAIASDVSTLQTTVGEHTASIQSVAEAIDGVSGKVGMKIDVDGYTTGWEMLGTGESGSVVWLVDNFIAGRPGMANQYPFVIGTVDGVQRVSMSNACIQDGAIKNAKIQNLTVERLKMASGALAGLSWGESVFAINTITYTANGTYKPPGSYVSIRTESRGRVLVSAYMRAQHWQGSISLGLYRNGIKVLDLGGSGGGAYDPAVPVMCFWIDRSPPDSSSTEYSIRVQKISGEAAYAYQRGISVTAIYR